MPSLLFSKASLVSILISSLTQELFKYLIFFLVYFPLFPPSYFLVNFWFDCTGARGCPIQFSNLESFSGVKNASECLRMFLGYSHGLLHFLQDVEVGVDHLNYAR